MLNTENLRPFLRWAGSKRLLLPRLRACIPETYDRYVEPFVGSGCLFFSLQPDQALLTDFNVELVNCYHVVRRAPIAIHNRCSKIDTSDICYKSVRSQNPSDLCVMDRAVRFLYLNSYCFNGVYRTNKQGQFNVPMGTKTKGVPSLNCLIECSKSLKKATIRSQDFRETLAETRSGDFVYLDPPYSKPQSRNRGEYGVGSFGIDDEEELINELKRLSKNGVLFLLSYRATAAFLRRLDSKWNVQRLRVQRHIAGFNGFRKCAVEVFVRNYEVT
jgi:DNA adenine methylase